MIRTLLEHQGWIVRRHGKRRRWPRKVLERIVLIDQSLSPLFPDERWATPRIGVSGCSRQSGTITSRTSKTSFWVLRLGWAIRWSFAGQNSIVLKTMRGSPMVWCEACWTTMFSVLSVRRRCWLVLWKWNSSVQHFASLSMHDGLHFLTNLAHRAPRLQHQRPRERPRRPRTIRQPTRQRRHWPVRRRRRLKTIRGHKK